MPVTIYTWIKIFLPHKHDHRGSARGFWGAGRMGSKWQGRREHDFKNAREQGAKESNLGSREHGQKDQEAGSKGQ